MKERFPRKRAGDRLSARRVTRTGKVCERMATFQPGPHLTGEHGGSTVTISGFPPWAQHVFEISAVYETIDGMYLGKVRWYSHQDEEWKTRGREWKIDCRELGLQMTVGDRLVAYWDEQRGMFVPTAPEIGRAVLTEALYPCEAAGAEVVNGECERFQTIEVVDYLDVLAGDSRSVAPVGTYVYFRCFPGVDRYEVLAVGGPLCCESSSSISGSSSSISGSSSSISGSTSASVSSVTSGECPQRIDGMHVNNLPTVTPTTDDYVLGIQDGCVVKFLINDCP